MQPFCTWSCYLLKQGQNGQHFCSHTFSKPYLNGDGCIMIQILLNLVLKGRIDTKHWFIYWLGAENYLNKYRPSLLMHICVTWHQVINMFTMATLNAQLTVAHICMMSFSYGLSHIPRMLCWWVTCKTSQTDHRIIIMVDLNSKLDMS